MPSGYTLPVFACASAIAALRHLQTAPPDNCVTLDLIEPPEFATVEIEQVAKIDRDCAIAITRSDPGDHLDLTRNTPVWAKVSLNYDPDAPSVILEGGEGIGKQSQQQNSAAIYSYARKLIETNLLALLAPDQKAIVTIILPEGTRLATRTSNQAFGVVEGLSLLGTTGIVQPLVAPEQLSAYQAEIKAKAEKFDSLVFCIGENGIDLAQRSGIEPQRIVKTANWLGSMLVTAAAAEIKSILLYGYHGKLIKLAGGIFHTHNHLADGRLAIMSAYGGKLGLSTAQIQQIFACPTTEAALNQLREWDTANSSDWVNTIYRELARAIDHQSQAYIYKYTERQICIGSVLFDRRRKTIYKSDNAALILPKLC
ncbi:MAG: cobalt-precorrin-5B (C(1))-methyltransferase CbiD [Cyanobacteria bacterium J06623_7]